jgi:hypothetical protein
MANAKLKPQPKPQPCLKCLGSGRTLNFANRMVECGACLGTGVANG